MDTFHAVRELARAGPIGVIMIVAGALAVLFAASGLVARRNRPLRDLAAGMAGASLATVLASTSALAYAARRALLEDMPPWSLTVYAKLEDQFVSQWFAAMVVLAVAPLLGATYAIASRRYRLVAIAAAASSVIVAGFVLRDALAVERGLYSELVDLHSRYQVLVFDSPSPGPARGLLLALGGGFALAAALGRRNRVASTWSTARGALVLIAGLTAWVLARPYGADADGPVPFWDESPIDTTFVTADVPPAPDGCRSGESYVLLVAASGSTTVDGVPTATLYATLIAKREVQRTLSPGVEPLVGIAADEDEDLTFVRRVIVDAGFTRIARVAARTLPDFPTATEGALRRSKRECVYEE